jgi:hypothetical protein
MQPFRRKIIFIFEKLILVCGNLQAAYIKFGCTAKTIERKTEENAVANYNDFYEILGDISASVPPPRALEGTVPFRPQVSAPE